MKEGAAVREEKAIYVGKQGQISLASPDNRTSLSCLYGCIDQTLSSSHSVEEELCRCQAGQIRVLHKASALGTVVIFDEMWQRAVFEAEGDSFTLHVLLSHHSNDLKKWFVKGKWVNIKSGPQMLLQCKSLYFLTWEMLIFDPLDPATTMDLKLLYSERDF